MIQVTAIVTSMKKIGRNAVCALVTVSFITDIMTVSAEINSARLIVRRSIGIKLAGCL